jgi:hypothetical protein
MNTVQTVAVYFKMGLRQVLCETICLRGIEIVLQVSALVEEWQSCYSSLVGTAVKVCVVDVASDGFHLVGHTPSYVQV